MSRLSDSARETAAQLQAIRPADDGGKTAYSTALLAANLARIVGALAEQVAELQAQAGISVVHNGVQELPVSGAESPEAVMAGFRNRKVRDLKVNIRAGISPEALAEDKSRGFSRELVDEALAQLEKEGWNRLSTPPSAP